MDNWEKIINGYREKAIAKEQNTVKYIDATVVAVREDYLRASVQLITGQTIDNMLNKSGEKLYVGRGVRVGYLTYPSKGWIDLANGEADPIHEGGGGDIWELETAAILNTGNFDNFNITHEEMVEISPTTKFYYGAKPAFIVLQGMLCYFGAGNVRTSTYPCQLDGSTEIFQSVIDNKEFFSASSYSSMTEPDHTLMTYPSGTNNTYVRYWSFAASTVQAVMNYRNSSLYLQQYVQPYSSRWTLDTGTKPTELKFYDDLSAEEKAAVVENDTWKYRDRGYGQVCHNGSGNLDQLADNIFVLPVVTAIYDTPTTPNGYSTPYGYAQVGNMYIVGGEEWQRPTYTVTAAFLSGTDNNSYMPFKSQAEHDFAMGMAKRSEPQEGSDG